MQCSIDLIVFTGILVGNFIRIAADSSSVKTVMKIRKLFQFIVNVDSLQSAHNLKIYTQIYHAKTSENMFSIFCS